MKSKTARKNKATIEKINIFNLCMFFPLKLKKCRAVAEITATKDKINQLYS